MLDRRPLAGHVADQVQQLEQRHGSRRAAADVEGFARGTGHVAMGEEHRVDEIVDEQDVAHLEPVTVERDRLAAAAPG